jgi:FixJ family two-component response regulator
MKNEMIAIVEDDLSVRAATSGLMESYGLPARAFASAEEFLDTCDLATVACLVAVVHLPGMGGIELQEHLRDRDLHLRVIIMTALPARGMLERVFAAGALVFFVKPFNGAAMVRHIKEITGGASTPRPSQNLAAGDSGKPEAYRSVDVQGASSRR